MLFQDVNQIGSGNSSSASVVVIGAGAVGLYAASQLAGRGCRVIVIESGNSDLGGFAAETYTTVGRAHAGIRLGRGRNLGGTTSLWGGQLVEFQRVDFDGRSWLPGSKWPVSYDEIAPYYRPTYQNLGMAARVLDDDLVWQSVSCKRPDLGADFEVFLTRWMKTPNFAELFARQIQADERMSVLTGHTAVGFQGAGGRLQAVRVVNEKGQSNWIKGDDFILAAGTIENSRLLLHTARDPCWDAPWRRNRNLGRYFQDHLGGIVASFHPVDKRQFFKMFCNLVYAGYKFQPKIRMSNEVLRRKETYNVQAFFGFESQVSEHLVYLKQFLKAALYGRRPSGMNDLFRKGLGGARYLLPLMWKYTWDHRVFVPSTDKINLQVQAEHAPCAESCIRIDESVVDSCGLPRVILDWRLAGNEITPIREFAIQIRDALRTSGIGELRIDGDLLSLNQAFLAKLGDTYHQAGGTIMAASEQDGVVDRNLRVFGTENLSVTGASIFRTASNANTTFTALAFTTRLVDHLQRVDSADGNSQIDVGSTSVAAS